MKISKEVYDALVEWKTGLNINGQYYVDDEDIYDLPSVIENWWRDDTHALEQNNRLIEIIRWVNGEDVFEVEKPKKWVVRSKETDDGGHYGYGKLLLANNNTIFMGYSRAKATIFDTKEEAESWANSHQEVIEVES